MYLYVTYNVPVSLLCHVPTVGVLTVNRRATDTATIFMLHYGIIRVGSYLQWTIRCQYFKLSIMLDVLLSGLNIIML